jgi:hypothetical protein
MQSDCSADAALLCFFCARNRSGLILNHIPTIADMRTLDFLAPAIAEAQQLVR